MYLDYKTNDEKGQEVLRDYRLVNGKRKKVKWSEHKAFTEDLSKAYERLENKVKAFRMADCGTVLDFKIEGDIKRLHHANFCKIRLCPMCAWRRSLKIFAQVSKIMTVYETDKPRSAFLFLTLTCRNVTGENLSRQIDVLAAAFSRLQKHKRFGKSVQAWFRCLEVTHNLQTDTYHPHYHVILAVDENYFGSGYYISQKEWTDIWQNCLKVDYMPIVDIRRFKASKAGEGKEIAEVAKYAAKVTDYVIRDDTGSIDEKRTDRAVAILDSALANRRLIAFGGHFRRLHKLLNLDDTEDGDLVHVSPEDLREDISQMIVRYRWHIGYKNYILDKN